MPAYGWARVPAIRRCPQPPPSYAPSPGCSRTRFFRVQLDAAGRITSLYDKRARARGAWPRTRSRNQFILFEDKPLNNDAWDIDIFYEEKSWSLDEAADGARDRERGPVRACIEVTRHFRQLARCASASTLYDAVPRIDFETWVDWHENQLLLKVAFPVAVHSRRATYEIQFGSIDRATHWNTSWD